MPLGTKGPPGNRRNVFLWWPIRLSFVWGRWFRGFTQHGVEVSADVEPLGIEGHAIMCVREVRRYQRCWNLGPLCIVFGEAKP